MSSVIREGGTVKVNIRTALGLVNRAECVMVTLPSGQGCTTTKKAARQMLRMGRQVGLKVVTVLFSEGVLGIFDITLR